MCSGDNLSDYESGQKDLIWILRILRLYLCCCCGWNILLYSVSFPLINKNKTDFSHHSTTWHRNHRDFWWRFLVMCTFLSCICFVIMSFGVSSRFSSFLPSSLQSLEFVAETKILAEMKIKKIMGKNYFLWGKRSQAYFSSMKIKMMDKF